MRKKLRNLYLALLAPAVLGFAIISVVRVFAEMHVGEIASSRPVAAVLFVSAFAFGVALPILYRTVFVNGTRGKKELTEEELLKFETGTLRIALVAPYVSLAAYLLEIPRAHFFGTVIAALYAGYYFYPSEKRDLFERKVFRVR